MAMEMLVRSRSQRANWVGERQFSRSWKKGERVRRLHTSWYWTIQSEERWWRGTVRWRAGVEVGWGGGLGGVDWDGGGAAAT